jgi:hypothetical protein
MLLYASLLFVHVLGAIALFAAIAVEVVSLASFEMTQDSREARTWLGRLTIPFRLGPPAMLAILLSGIAMMATRWGHQAWLVAAFIGLVAMGAIGGLVSVRGLRRLRAALELETGPALSDAFRSVRSRTSLVASVVLRATLGIGIVALMSFKPDALGSSLVLAAAAVVGLFVGQAPFAARRSLPADA